MNGMEAVSWYRAQHVTKMGKKEHHLDLIGFQAGAWQPLLLPCWSVLLHREQQCLSD